MNLATIEAIRHRIAEIAKENRIVPAQNDYRTGAAELHTRIDNYLCELIAENGGEVKETEVFRYIEVRTFGNPVQKIVHRENEYGGSAYFWQRRIKELEKKVNNPELFVDVFEYDTKQELIDYFSSADKEWAGYTEAEQNCRGCMGPCGRCDEPDIPEPEPEIPWDKLPKWVEWVAMDANKKWYLYSLEPSKKGTKWWPQDIKNGICINCNNIPFTAPDWRTSLRQRPKTNEQC